MAPTASAPAWPRTPAPASARRARPTWVGPSVTPVEPGGEGSRAVYAAGRARGTGERRPSASPWRSASRSTVARSHVAIPNHGERSPAIPGVGPVPVTTARALLDGRVGDRDDPRRGRRDRRVEPEADDPDEAAPRAQDRYPTCGVKSSANDQYLEIDHVIPIEDHGPTELTNLWRICTHHHTLQESRKLESYRPTGRPGPRPTRRPRPAMSRYL